MDKTKKLFHEQVAERLIEQLKQGTAPWQKPWKSDGAGLSIPHNPITGKRYKGINVIQLMSQERVDPRWMTYKQAASQGAQVRKGENGTLIEYWKFSEEQVKKDSNGKPLVDENGKLIKQEVKLERPRMFFATVFNAEQIDGLPPMLPRRQKWNSIKRAENILSASGAVIQHGEQNRAFYRPSTDSIHLPDKAQFPNADNYYATALHELGHWTGHPSRLNRDLAHPFGSVGYAKEELRAEIASMILGEALGISCDPGQHAAYVDSWIKILQDDPREIFRAAADAEKIQNYVLTLEQQIVQEIGIQQNQEKTQSNVRGQEGVHMNSLHSSLVLNKGEAEVARTFLDLKTANTFNRQLDANVFETVATKHLGFTLPTDWTGQVEIAGVVELNGQIIRAQDSHQADAFQLYARKSNVQIGDNAYAYLTTCKTENEAVALRERLTLINAYSQIEESERTAIFARIEEERVRRDPNSTEEAILAAKEVRKSAETYATSNDKNFQRYIAGYEREQRKEEAGNYDEDEHEVNTISDQIDQLNREAFQENIVQQAQLDNLLNINAQINLYKKIYINVPYDEKDQAKILGARWDKQEQSWYVPAGVELSHFEKWTQSNNSGHLTKESDVEDKTHTRQYLVVPYEERQAAKDAGALWDKHAKSWYVDAQTNMSKLQSWLPDNVLSQQDPAITPRKEFANFLRSLGCDVTGEHPVMDGKKHRISVEGDRKGERAGFYVAYMDGQPAGYIKNNRTGAEKRWKAKGYVLDQRTKLKLQTEALNKLQMRVAEQERLYEQSAQRISKYMENLVPVFTPTPYMLAKCIEPRSGVFTDKDGEKTYIPAIDSDGKQWTMQYIQADGTKRFAKNCKKEGCFHVIGGLDALKQAATLIIAEGYATAASLNKVLGCPVIAAFDCGNLKPVAMALREKFPHKHIVIAGDDDRHLEKNQGINPGKVKAQEAAQAVSGKAVFPIFAPGEQDSNQKGFTDFNDLASKSVLGIDGVERQMLAVINTITEENLLVTKQIQDQQITAPVRNVRRVRC